MSSGIYLIRNSTNGKIYIGSAVNTQKRFLEHKYALRKNCHCNIHLQRAWNKEGENSFVFEEYLECNKDKILFYEQLVLDAMVIRCGRENIYNICPKVGNTLGRYHSEETKFKIRLKSKGRWTGKNHTEETKRKMSKVQKGRIISLETRKKMSKSHLGIKLPPFTREHKQKIRLANLGHGVSKETRQKLRIANIGKVIPKEVKRKIGDAFRGKPGTRLGIKNKLKIQ